jgi:anti-sigma-K factor RskA
MYGSMSKSGQSPPEQSGDDRIVAAGEVSLGLARKSDLDRELAADPALAREVERWNADFAKLADELEPVAPRPSVWNAIQQQMHAARTRPVAARSWLESLLLWRLLAGAGLAAACVLAIIVALPRGDVVPAPTVQVLLVSALLPKDGPPLYTATYDTSRRLFIVVPAAIQHKPQRLPQLWLVPNDSDDPIALGSLGEDRPTAITVSLERAALVTQSSGLVVTEEPAGGMTANGPGPVLGHGRLESY